MRMTTVMTTKLNKMLTIFSFPQMSCRSLLPIDLVIDVPLTDQCTWARMRCVGDKE